jgi:ribosome maturation factor RimP
MRADSRHRLSRPDRVRGGADRTAAPRPGSRPGADPAELERLLEPVVRAAGMDLESVRVTSAGRRRLLRVVVDADGGVSLDGIALVSREVSARLDGAGAMGEAPYTLEVSSPGVDRPLTLPRHWRRAAGRLVRVPLAGPGDNGLSSPAPAKGGQAGPVEGRVIAAGDSGVILEVDGEQREFGYAELGPGRVQVEFGERTGGMGDGH